MVKENKKKCNKNKLNFFYEKAKDEDFLGSNMLKLIELCKLYLYYYPLKINAVKEENISQFYLLNHNKIRNTILNYNLEKTKFNNYYFNYIKICIKYYKLKINHDNLKNNLILEILVNDSDSFEKETFFDDNSNNPVTIANYKCKLVEEEQKKYFDQINPKDFNNQTSLKDLYNIFINTKNIIENDEKFSYLNSLKDKLYKKSTRKNLLLLFMTMPDAILENYIHEVSYLFSVSSLQVINLFTYSSDLLQTKKLRYEKYTDLNNKHYKNYLLNNYKLTSKMYNEDLLKTSINWDKKAMDKNAIKIRKTLNMHVSQRTLAKELSINKGTVASSISAAKRLLTTDINKVI